MRALSRITNRERGGGVNRVGIEFFRIQFQQQQQESCQHTHTHAHTPPIHSRILYTKYFLLD